MSLRSLSIRWRNARLELRRRVAARFISDRAYVTRLYRKAFGRSPDLDHPSGFNEKILVKILGDRRPYLTLFSDKLRVREYVQRVAPFVALPALYWWSDRADALDVATLPDSFVLKPNHGSGWLRVVDDRRTVQRDELVCIAREWLASVFGTLTRPFRYARRT